MRYKVWLLLLTMAVTTSSQAVEIDLSSARDFIRMELLLKDIDRSNPDLVSLTVTLSPQAAERMEKVSRESIGQPLTLLINGRAITTATVHSAIGAQLQVAMSRAIAKDLLPTLLD
ncbi:hypothetical protein D3C85_411040 [compost metagenome]